MKSSRRWSRASGSTKRRVEKIVRLGTRATRRSFVAAQRPASSPDHHSINISEGRTYDSQ
jgi:hypothetical protein